MKRGVSGKCALALYTYHSIEKGTLDNFREKLPKYKYLLHLLSF